MISQRTFLFLTYLLFKLNELRILSKGCKPDNFKSHNSLKLTFTIFETSVRILLITNLSLKLSSLQISYFKRLIIFKKLILKGNLSASKGSA